MGHRARPRPARRERQSATGIAIAEDRDADLPQVALALAAGGSLPGLLHRRQEQADQRAHDRDHDQDLDQREAVHGRAAFHDSTGSHGEMINFFSVFLHIKQ